MTPVDDLPLTQYLLLEVLAARVRAGDDTWTLPNRTKPALKALEASGLVWYQSAPVACHQLAGLTDKGREAMLLDGYKSTWQEQWEQTEEAARQRELLARMNLTPKGIIR